MRGEMTTRVVGALLGTLATFFGCNNSSSQSAATVPTGGQQASMAAAPMSALGPSAASPVAQPSAAAPHAMGQGSSVSGIAGLARVTVGSAVDVTGKFFGWRGPCRGVPPTRSAWQLADDATPGAACVYVDGPMPAGLDPTGDSGMVVRVRGTLETYEDTTYVRAQSTEIVP
jgi:hypothetical protein